MKSLKTIALAFIALLGVTNINAQAQKAPTTKAGKVVTMPVKAKSDDAAQAQKEADKAAKKAAKAEAKAEKKAAKEAAKASNTVQNAKQVVNTTKVAPVAVAKPVATRPAPTPKAQPAPKPQPVASGSDDKGRQIMTGARGGQYYINKNGNKTYIKK